MSVRSETMPLPHAARGPIRTEVALKAKVWCRKRRREAIEPRDIDAGEHDGNDLIPV